MTKIVHTEISEEREEAEEAQITVEGVAIWTEDEAVNATQATVEGVTIRTEVEAANATQATVEVVETQTEDGTVRKTREGMTEGTTANHTGIENTTADSIQSVLTGDASKTAEGTRRMNQESRIVLLISKRVIREFHPHHRLDRRTPQKARVSTSIPGKTYQRSSQIMAENQ